MIYQWKIPNLYNVDPQDAGREIEDCKDADGLIQPEFVVEKAKAATSVIHGCFEWDDAKAAVQHRLHQAGALIRNIVTVQIDDKRLDAPVRAFVNIRSETQRGYKTISTVVGSPDDYQYMLQCAKDELRAFAKKYETLSELSSVLSAIWEVIA